MSQQVPILYDVLGVAHDATQEDITHAFQRLAEMYHPDLVMLQDAPPALKRARLKEANERFPEIEKAYTWLGDPENRATYDKYLENAAETMRKAPPWFG